MNVPTLLPCRWLLVIEDDDDARELMRDVLELEGYAVSLARDGREGLTMLRRMSHPCLILLDWRMPVMSGAQFLATLFEREGALQHRVVVLSGANDAQRARREPDVVGVLMKPVETQELLGLVEAHCMRALSLAPQSATKVG